MSTTSPDNISYPTNASAKKTIEGHLLDTATSIQIALNTKAASSHSHATTDITSGTLEVARGGTGVSTLTSGAYLKGAGTSAITVQTGIPAGDITSGQLNAARMTAGSVVQVVGITTTTTLAGTLGAGSATPTSGQGSQLTSFNFTPKFSTSKLLLQSSAVVVGEYNNVQNDFYMAAYYGSTLVALQRNSAAHFHFSGSLNLGWLSFNHIFNSWGTSTETISIRIGGDQGSSMYANYPYFTNVYSGGTAGFTLTEVAQ